MYLKPSVKIFRKIIIIIKITIEIQFLNVYKQLNTSHIKKYSIYVYKSNYFSLSNDGELKISKVVNNSAIINLIRVTFIYFKKFGLLV